jgi:Domain of unknown function (DUF4190)
MTELYTTPVPRTSTLAIVSIVTGIASWIIIPFLGAIIAIVTGHMAKSEIRGSAGELTGDGLATVGLVLGYIQIVLTCGAICVITILALMAPSISEIFSNIASSLLS